MTTPEDEARQRRRERKQILQKQAAINEQLLAILDDEEQAEDSLSLLAASTSKRFNSVHDDGPKQNQTNNGFATPSSHQPSNHMIPSSARNFHREIGGTADEVAFLSASARPLPPAEPTKRKRPADSTHVLGSDSEDDRPLSQMRRKKRKSSMPKSENNAKVRNTPTSTAPPSAASAFMAPASTAPASKPMRRGFSHKYKIFHPTLDNKYAMIVMVGDQVVELACCFCGGNYFKSGPGWKALVGVHGLAKQMQLGHKDKATEAVGKGAFDWVIGNCVRKILLRSEIAEVLAETYFVEEIHVRTQTQ